MEYKKNDIFTVTIEDMGSEGEGIGKKDGYTLFVKDAIIGDTVRCKIMKAKKNYAYARLEEILTPSSLRVKPKCRFHRQCGGCQIQAMDYHAQLTYKQNKVRNHLIRIGGLSESLIDTVMEPIVGMQTPYRYRNKAQFPFAEDREGHPVTGFYAGRTHDIVPNTDCCLGAAENKEILEVILAYMHEYKVSAYHETTGKGLIRHVLIRKGFINGQLMVCFVVNSKVSAGIQTNKWLPQQERLIEALSAIEGMTSVSVSPNTEQTNVIMGEKTFTIWGNETITDRIHRRNVADFSLEKGEAGIDFQISPLSFYQVNPVQTEKLYSIALDYAELTGKETVWDLYCGIGTISLFMAGKAKNVCGVEIIPQAIEDARTNAEANGISNVEFFVGRVEEVLPDKYKQDKIHADVIVVDPPRKGCDEKCLETMLSMQPERIVYVSCDSATLARDVKVLCSGGYEVKRVRAVDQFGMTVHIEVVIQMTYCGDKAKNKG